MDNLLIELPEGYNVENIDIDSIRSSPDGKNMIKISEKSPTIIGDFDLDGTPDLMAKFDRSSVQNIVIEGMAGLAIVPPRRNFSRGRLVAGATSTFARLGLKVRTRVKPNNLI